MQSGKASSLKEHRNYGEHRYLRVATEEDANYLAPILRQCDKDEIKAHSNISAEDALIASIKLSELPLVVVDHKPVAIFGVVPNGDVGFVWLMATPDLQKIGFPFLRECMRVVQLFNDRYLVLSNFVDARNKLHIRWLKWCGFKFINKHKRYGVAQIPFYEFVRIK